MNKIEKILFSIIILLAILLRFWQLGQNPPSLTWDEAAWGYNAYSLGIDGRDEFGRFMPYDYLESFGDFKPPMYAYLDVIPTKLFGMNEFSTRFPSALFGVLTVFLTYFLTKRIFYKSLYATKYSLISSALLAISPWHVNLSRAAFEANIATFFIILGVWLFIYAMDEKRWFLLLSIFSFVLSVYTFNTARIVSPMMILMLVLVFRDELLKKKKETFLACIFGVLLLLPTAKFLLSPQARLRYQEVNIFSDLNVIKRINQSVINDNNVWWSKFIHNRRFEYSVEYLRHYFDNLTLGFLFVKGDGNPKFSTQDVGEMYLWEAPFLIIGVLILFRKKERKWWIIPAWLLISIIPAATARETPHALRIETSLPTFQILVSYGLVNIFYVTKIFRRVFTYSVLCIIFFSFIFYLHGYYGYYPYEFSHEWQYGYKESIQYVKEVENKYAAVNVSNTLGRPYIYYLYYTQTDPRIFRRVSDVTREVFGFVHVNSFGKYYFGSSSWVVKKKNQKILYVDNMGKVPVGANILKKFKLYNGNENIAAFTL